MKKIFVIFVLSINISGVSLGNVGILEKKFNQDQIKKIIDYKNSYNKISTAIQFEAVIKKATELKKLLEPDLNKQFEKLQQTGKNPTKDDFKWLTTYLPGLKPVPVAEGTMLDLAINYQEFKAKAAKTPEKSDDEFIGLMINTFGDYETYYPKWFNQTWDYGGCSFLGKGIHTNTLFSINSILRKDKFFKNELDMVKNKALDDILNWNTFCETKENVIREVNQIIKTAKISPSEKLKLEKRIKQFQKGGKTFQFNCNKVNCSYG